MELEGAQAPLQQPQKPGQRPRAQEVLSVGRENQQGEQVDAVGRDHHPGQRPYRAAHQEQHHL